MSGPADGSKLTKKQRKAAEFKQQKKGGAASKGQGKNKREADDVPEEDLMADEPVADELHQETAAVTQTKQTKKKGDDLGSKKKAATASGPQSAEASTSAPPKKRKRAQEVSDSISAPEASTSAVVPSSVGPIGEGKAKKTAWDESGEATEITASQQSDGKSSTSKGKKKESSEDASRKLIVFVGNMSFKSTAEQIKAHFASHCGEEPAVRLLTTKSDTSQLSKSKQKSIAKGKAADTTVRSRGCAFLEFQTSKALQKALGLHHLQFGGRQINVELTAGGGGNKSAARKDKIAEKNRALNEERKKLHEKYVQPAQEKKKADLDEKRAKGEHVGPPKKKIKAGEVGEAQWGRRGGANASTEASKPKRMPSWMASGANAVRLSG